MFNNNTTDTFSQNVPWKNFENRSIFDEYMDNHKVGRFFETQCTKFATCPTSTVNARTTF